MAAKNVDIKINTTASGTGAKQTEDGLKKVGEEAEKSSKKRISAEERAALKAEQAAQKAADAAVREEQRKTAATEAEAAKRVKAEQKAQAQVEQATAKSASRRSQMAGQVGLQAQDIAVQAQMGTSAVTILAQQGTQIASIFGPQGAIVGALIGVGAVAAKVFYDMAVASAVTGEAMEDMSDKLKEAFDDQAKKSIEDFNAQLQNQTNIAQSLREVEVDLLEARLDRQEADSSIIASQSALEVAAVKYLQTIGQTVNAEKQLAAIRKSEAEAQKAAQIQDIENQVTVARERYKQYSDQYQEVQGQTDQAQKRLAELEKRQQELMSSLNFSRRMDAQSRDAGTLGQDETSGKTNALTAEMDALKKEIGGIYNIINKAPERLAEITNQAIVSASSLQNLVDDSASQIAKINEKYNLTTKAQELGATTELITKGAAEIVKVISEFDAVTPLQQQAKAEALEAASDGVITAQEQIKISGNLRTLMSSLKTGQEGNLKTLQDLLKLNDTIGVKMQQMSNQIKGLKEKISNIKIS
jgi:Zn-dependent alcohol dehydrogenase